MSLSPRPHARHVVTAVLVAHNGSRWLPESLSGLLTQTVSPQRIVAADTGSTDETRAILGRVLSDSAIISLPASTGFGAAVSTALRAWRGAPDVPGGEVEWVWLLHDDSTPAPDALERLLDEAERSPSAAVLGPKLRGWYDRRQLVEVGVTMAGSGRRETGLESGEQDQGQHDTVRDVLAVSTAGMLVRRDVFEALGGLDPALPLFRDDIDLCWRVHRAGHRVLVVPDAVVFHAQAASTGRRRLSATRDRPHYVDRRHAGYVLAVNRSALVLPWIGLRLVVGGLARALGFLLAKAPGFAFDELAAVLGLLARPDRVLAGRLSRRRTATVGPGRVRPLLAPAGSGLRHSGEVLAGLLAGAQRTEGPLGRHLAVESGPADEASEDLSTGAAGLFRRLAARPAVLLGLGLGLLALLAERSLIGAGQLIGGALLPAPDGASDLWSRYLASWHDVGLGSAVPAPPWLAVLAAFAGLLGGHAPLAVDLLVLCAVPVAGVLAYLALGPAVRSARMRAWAAVGYALLPAMTGALASGRIGTLVVLVGLPVLGMAAARTIGWPGRAGSSRAAFAGGLVLAVLTAFVPIVYPMAVVLALMAAAALVRGAGWARLAVLVLVPPALLVPWTARLVSHPGMLLTEPGLPLTGAAPRPDPYAVLLLHPGGPGMYPVALSGALVAAGLVALLRSDRRRLLWSGWAVAVVGFATALAVNRVDVAAPSVAGRVPVWAGTPTAVAGAGVLLAAVVGAERARTRLTRLSFGWRQIGVTAVAGLALVSPVVVGAWWVHRGAGAPLVRHNPTLLPAYVAAQGASPLAPRTLVLSREGVGLLSYALLAGNGPRLGDADLLAPASTRDGLSAVVADLASGRGPSAAEDLTHYGVRYVLLAAPVDAGLARQIDGVPGLTRMSSPGGGALWQTIEPVARARVVDATGASVALLPTDGARMSTRVPAGQAGRSLVLAERSDAGWQACLDGRRLPPRTVDGWAQGFDLPSTGGLLVVSHAGGTRDRWTWVELGVLAIVLFGMTPSLHRGEPTDDPAAAHVRRPANGGAAEDQERRRTAGQTTGTAGQTPGTSA